MSCPIVSLAATSYAQLGEAPHWIRDSQTLLWVDILAPAVCRTQMPGGTTTVSPLTEQVGVVVPRRDGGCMAATQSGFLRLEPETGEMHTFAIPPQGMVGCRFNDGKCDAMGRLWAGTLSLDGTPGQGALFRLDTDGSVHLIESGFDVCNGLGWSPDSTRFYLTDSGQRSIFVYDFDVTLGLVSNKRRLVRFDGIDGTPDGLSVDQEGNLWCAMWDGWAIQQIRPNGSTGKAIRLPLPRPTSCAFGGDDGKTLFITSARTRLTADQLAEAPLSGSILSVSMDIPGAYVDIYGG